MTWLLNLVGGKVALGLGVALALAIAAAGGLGWLLLETRESLGAAEEKNKAWASAYALALVEIDRQRTYAMVAEKKQAEATAALRSTDQKLARATKDLHNAKDAKDRLPDTWGDLFDQLRLEFFSAPAAPSPPPGLPKQPGVAGGGRPTTAPRLGQPERSAMVRPSPRRLEALRDPGRQDQGVLR